MAASEKKLQENGNNGFVVGDKLTIADFAFGTFVNSLVLNDGNIHSSLFK